MRFHLPTKIRMFFFGLHDPMQISHSVFHMFTQICLNKHVDCQSLAWFLDQWNLQLSENLASSPITTIEIFRADSICLTCYIIFEKRKDCLGIIRGGGRFTCVGEERGIKATGKAIQDCMTNEDGFE